MKRSMLILPMAALALAALAPPAFANRTLAERIEATYEEYTGPADEPTIEQLVHLDAALRDIAAATRKAAFQDRSVAANASYRDEFEAMGVYIGHLSGFVQYSGALLVRAHKQDPNSAFRAHTLFATISSADPPREAFGMPDLNAAYQYIAEFPEGPFIFEAYEILATCYDDFYKSLHKFMTKTIYEDDVHMTCFRPFMTPQPYEQQIARVQVLALEFYRHALHAAGDNERKMSSATEKLEKFRKMLGAEDKSRFQVWYWCSDC